MLRHFWGSILVTIVGFVAAYFWAERVPGASGLGAVFAVFFLSVLEVTLSFDNAIVNAQKLEHMSPEWRRRFLTWGILIAVFGTRLVFPVLFVAIFANISLMSVVDMAINDVDKYAQALHDIHPPLITFGGTFMLMLCLSYFICHHKDDDSIWIRPIEKPLARLGKLRFLPALASFAALGITVAFVKADMREEVFVSGSAGIILYIAINLAIHYATRRMERKQRAAGVAGVVKTGFWGFMYLEVIDASFSLDGVLSAFAITKDVVIMAIGLAIGAMFVRSFTVYMVDHKTLQRFAHLESGAHWAVGSLALIMFVSAAHEVPEAVTGSIALFIIIASFISSIMKDRRERALK